MTLTADALARIHAAAFVTQRPWTPAEFSALLDASGLVLCGDARGFLIGRIVADEAELLTVATLPDAQRQGLADSHLRQFLDIARSKNAVLAFLEVAQDNIPANQLYQKHGFAVVGRRLNYYRRPDGTRVTANVMQKRLG